MSDKYEVFDGTDDKKNCTDQEKTEWTYNIAVYLHGAAVMYNYTKGDETWKKHTSGLLEHTAIFFKPYDNATDIMFEQRCETFEKCNIDQLSFKAYLGRFLVKAAIMAPFTKEQVTTWLRASAVGAAKSCAGKDESACGSKWYVDGWDGTSGVGQQLSALEVTQALLTLKKGVVPGTGGNQPSPSSSTTPGASSTSSVVEVSSKWISTLPITAASSVSSSASDISSTDALTSAVSSTAPASSDAAPAPSSSAPASSDAAPAASTKAGAEFGEQPTAGSASASTTCAPTSTTTLYVPPSSSSKCSSNTTTTAVYVPPTVSAVPTHSANATVSISPPANTTGPEQFPGTATNNRVAAITVVVAALIVAVGLKL
jgi:mannan endo-1,6-alpha-mannosidase